MMGKTSADTRELRSGWKHWAGCTHGCVQIQTVILLNLTGMAVYVEGRIMR